MARPALSASRSIDVIELLSRFPDREFSLAEIARATSINVSSCHAILTALSERGYLLRNSIQKTYRLGPSLIAIGIASTKGQPIIAQIQRVARELLGEVGYPLLLTTIAGSEILALMTFDNGDGRSLGMHVGERLPLIAPVGAPFLCWADEAAQSSWIGRRTTPLSRTHLADLRRDLEMTRERGFHVLLRSDRGPSIGSLLTALSTTHRVAEFKEDVQQVIDADDYLMTQPDKLEAEHSYDVMLIAAPIFDRTGTVSYNLCMGGFTHRLTGDRISALAEQLMRSCLEVSRAERQ